MKRIPIICIIIIFFVYNAFAQDIPSAYSNLNAENGKIYLNYKGEKIEALPENGLSLKNLIGKIKGTESGIQFDFNMSDFNGNLYYGFIKPDDGKFAQPVFFKRTAKITQGKAFVDIKKNLSGVYDMIEWEKTGKGLLGYRVQDHEGRLIYDGRIAFRYSEQQGFSIDNTIVEGPFVTILEANGATIFFTTNNKIKCSVEVDGKTFSDHDAVLVHEIKITNLKPETKYEYKVIYGDNTLKYSFKTAPEKGSRQPFVFAYASDSRGGNGGGERNFYGPNAYMVKKIAALALYEHAAFVQFTGDLVSGYTNNPDDIDLQYANWKRSVEPFWHYVPFIATMGNHEFSGYFFNYEDNKYVLIDGFPYDKYSAEAIFARNFVNPHNGPVSEDGSKYDPDKNKQDFPSYDENVFSYVYGNVAMIVLNSNYWYSPSLKRKGELTSGNLHGYIMDNQLKWLEKTIEKYEKDKDIDHIFVTMHTPCFPNGGHSKDDMWYAGDNNKRAIVNGKPVDKGIIERRDDILDLVINKSSKTVAFLTGDEHNFNVMTIDNKANIYPENWNKEKINLKRTFYQINNGSAGAPYYAQEKLPWSDHVEGFTTQNALVFVYVDGKKVKIKVINPDTLDIILEKQLK